jgi:hypothetical protein
MKSPDNTDGFSRRDVLRAAGALALAYPLRPALALFADEGPSKMHTDNLALRFAKYYKPVKVETKPSIPAYELPLDLGKVANFKDVAAALKLDADEPSLKKNGFAVLPGKGNEDIVEPYKHLKALKVPLFITADTLLHLYHVQFDETLKDIEEREFYKDVVALTEALLGALNDFPTGDDVDLKTARSKALTFFTIGLRALKPADKADAVSKEVAEVLEQMKKHEGFWPDPDKQPCPWALFRYSAATTRAAKRSRNTSSA